MAAITFDTLKFANRLKAAGAEPKLAEAEAEALGEVFEVGAQELATKADLREMEGGFKTEIHQLRHEMREMEQRLDGRMREMKAEMGGEFKRMDGELKLNRWMTGVMLAGVLSLVLKAFFGH